MTHRDGAENPPHPGSAEAPRLHRGFYEVHLPTTNLRRSMDFYTDRLGFRHGFGVPADGGVLLLYERGDSRWMLGLFEVEEITHRHAAEHHVSLRVAERDADRMIPWLVERGIEPVHPPNAPLQGRMTEPIVHGWMPAAAVFFRDPDGHLLELIADLPHPPRREFVYRPVSEWLATVDASPERPTIEFQLADVRTLLGRTPKVLETWLDGLPDPWLRNREGPGSWSVHEVVGHLVHGEKTDWIPRLRQMLEGRGDEPFSPFDRSAMLRVSADLDTGHLLREFGRLRKENLDALEALAPARDHLDERGLHPELGPVTVRQLLATWVAHDQTHISQIARVVAKQYHQEVGPWRSYLPLLDRPGG